MKKKKRVVVRINRVYTHTRASQVAGAVIEKPPAKQEMQVQSLDWEDPLEKELATHSNILPWEIPWTEEPGGLYSPWGHKRVRHDVATKQ